MISPRANETQAVIDILESEDFDDAKAMARAVVTAVAAELSKREQSYGVGVGLMTDAVVLPHGPYYSLTDAKRVVRDAESLGLRAFIAPLYSPTDAIKDKAETLRPCVCGHEKWQHWDRGACATFHRSYSGERARIKPNLPQCGCKAYNVAEMKR